MKIKNILLYIIFFLSLFFLITISLYFCNTTAVNKSNDKQIMFEIKKGDTANEIGENLFDKKLIKNFFVYKIYVKINNGNSFKAGYYNLNQTMDLKTIINILDGTTKTSMKNSITFKEGKTIKDLALLIENKTNYKQSEILELINNKQFINELIKEYWFLTTDILNSNIYYSLEGYLFPNTYDIYDLTKEEIIKILLNETNKNLSKYKDKINNYKYSIHEIMSLASMVELEGNNSDNRKLIASVFYNRLDDRITLGSDVTTYYAVQKKITEKLTKEDLNSPNLYNTRYINNYNIPIGPICNPSLESIDAVLNPTKSNYYYFVADVKGNIYFMKTYDEHRNKINELNEKGLW